METKTYTVLDCREFDTLVAEHLGLTLKTTDYTNYPEVITTGDWDGMQQDLMASQDTFVIFENDPSRWDESEPVYTEYLESPDVEYDTRGGYGALTEKLAGDLFRKGVFPPEHDVFVKVWW